MPPRGTPPSTPLDEIRARMIAATQSVAPGKITEDHARQLLQDAAAWQPRGVRTLHRYLMSHPGCLSSPDPHAPITAVRLAYGLHAAGCRVELPACARCGKRWPRLIRLAPEGRCCEWCVTKANTVTCDRCGKTGYPTAVRPDGKICRTCYQHEPQRTEKCIRCGRVRAPSTRDDSGDPLCGTCARPQHICTQCGRTAIAKKFSDTGPLCARCYEPPRRPCGGCGRIVAIAHRRGGEHPDLCKRCRPERTHRCVVCSRVRPAKAIWPKGPVCRACYRQALIHPDPCATCSRIGVLTANDLTGRAVCGPCAGSSIDYRCTTCDQPAYSTTPEPAYGARCGAGQQHCWRTNTDTSAPRYCRSSCTSPPRSDVPTRLCDGSTTRKPLHCCNTSHE